MTTPSLLKVIILPANGTAPHTEKLPTVDTLPKANDLTVFRASSHGLHFRDAVPYKPNIRIQPNPCDKYWSAGEWAEQVVIDLDPLHILYSKSKEEHPLANLHIGNETLSGDVFILLLSEDTDSDRRRTYEDILPDATWWKEDSAMVESIVAALRDWSNGGGEVGRNGFCDLVKELRRLGRERRQM